MRQGNALNWYIEDSLEKEMKVHCEVFFINKSRISYFHVFVHKPNMIKNHSAKAWKGILEGYESNHQQGYRIYLPESNEVIVSNLPTAQKVFLMQALRLTAIYQN